MPPSDSRTQASVLDRLIDEDPENSREGAISQAQTVRQFKAAMRRDLEWLLNTRCTIEPLGEEYEALGNSVYMYGLPDFSSYGIGSAQTRTRLLRGLRRAIELFEPRLMQVEVTPVDNPADREDRSLNFLISGLLRVDPAPEHVAFDTRLEPGKGEYRVREA